MNESPRVCIGSSSTREPASEADRERIFPSLAPSSRNDLLRPIVDDQSSKEKEHITMRRLAFALVAAATLGIAGPASAQTIYVDDGYRSGWWGGYGYSAWVAPHAEVYVVAPRAEVYGYEDAPRYRYRRSYRSSGDAYAYGGPELSPRYRSDGPYVVVGGGYSTWDYSYRDRDWWWGRW
jgi:hypothetical protein